LLVLDYVYGHEKERAVTRISLEVTWPHFGGLRWWGRCPIIVNGVACDRRVRKLYLRGRYFGCRQCHKLTYWSCQENHALDWFLDPLAERMGVSRRAARWLHRMTTAEQVPFKKLPPSIQHELRLATFARLGWQPDGDGSTSDARPQSER
jgi:hypothetical protein